MRKSLIRPPLALGLALFSGWLAASPMTNLLGQLSQFDYQDYVGNLQAFGTRYFNTQGNVKATNYLADTLNSFGLSVRQDAFDYGGTRYNVEATLPGLVTPNQIFIIGAHFDSTSNDPQTNAPGADDNASGTAAMLEIASVLSQYQFASTIRFIGFNAEEQGLIGSNAYAAAAQVRGDTIVGMLNLDMIAYTAGLATQDLEVMGDKWLVDRFIADAATYVPGLLTQAWYGDYYGSDHYYFHSSRYPGSSSLFGIEDTATDIWSNSNPYYHKTTDTADRLDYGFAYKVTQASAATLADLAGLIPEPPIMLLLLPGLLLAARGRRVH
ncbi:M28 family metallopeptidase [Candidatus Thiodictyon syntrophicum]|nr:M28 family peptidase [Candidatus Thiodictyon syntrophicum]